MKHKAHKKLLVTAAVLLVLILGVIAAIWHNDSISAFVSTSAEGTASDCTGDITAGEEADETGGIEENPGNDSEITEGNSDDSLGAETGAEEPVTEEPEISIIAVGDIMLGRGVGYRLQKAGGFEKAFEKVSHILSRGDITFGNLETPLTDSNHGLDKERKIVLKAKPESVVALTQAGFDILSLSNNHIMDYYEKGLFDTMAILEENGIRHVGGGRNMEEARKPVIIEKNGLKVGFLAYTDMAELVFAGKPYLSFAAGEDKSGVVPRKYETILEDVEKFRSEVDLVAVSLHWGIEESFKILPEQVEFAHNLIDNGVDIILGHHPHQFQGIEVYKGKPIIYSMGNFLFDQNDPENMESFIIELKYRGTELTEFSAIPVRILEKSYVEVQTGEKASNILNRQIELCQKLGTKGEVKDDVLVLVDGSHK